MRVTSHKCGHCNTRFEVGEPPKGKGHPINKLDSLCTTPGCGMPHWETLNEDGTIKMGVRPEKLKNFLKDFLRARTKAKKSHG